MDYSTHTMLAGDSAADFATEMGFIQEDLTTPTSQQEHDDWLAANCQPNYRVNVQPDPTKSCGPYTPLSVTATANNVCQQLSAPQPERGDQRTTSPPAGHDTISMVVVDAAGIFASGTSTNGLANKIPGRVGDGPIPGSGSYSDNSVGGCGATGQGDVLMRFLPCVLILEFMRNGQTPTEACEAALRRIIPYFPSYVGAVIALSRTGEYGAAAYNLNNWQYAIRTPDMSAAQVVDVPPITML